MSEANVVGCVCKIKPGDKNCARERLLKHLLFRKENSNIANDNKTIRWIATHEK
jgi:hypothetical protein